MIRRVIEHPVKEVVQNDGRIRGWAQLLEMDGKYLRVILLPDGETAHNVFLIVHSPYEDKMFSRHGYAVYRISRRRYRRDKGSR